MSDLRAALDAARTTGDFTPFVDAIPYARFLGIGVEKNADELVTRLTFSSHVIGNALIPALHGGAIGSLLESAAIFGLLWESRNEPGLATPRIINITVEYLRTARTIDTLAAAEITRQGRRVATVRAFAWQEDRARPIAVANAHFLLATPAETPAP